MATANSRNDKLSFGIIILIFGLLYLFDKLGFLSQLPFKYDFISVNSGFFISGIVFVCTQPKRVLSWILLGVGLLLNANHLFSWIGEYSKFIIPIVAIIAGIALILSHRK